MKKALGDISILHMCNNRYHHMMYGFSDKVVMDRQTDRQKI